MNRWLLIGSMLLAVPAHPQDRKHLMVATLTSKFPVSVSADQIERIGPWPSLVRMIGGVEIKMPVCVPVGPDRSQVCDGYMILRAERATMHEDTGQIESDGNVSLSPLLHEK